jgi:hypothetical protein
MSIVTVGGELMDVVPAEFQPKILLPIRDEDISYLPRDIELVMKQAGVSHGVAIRLLDDNDGDIVSAIMEAQRTCMK